MSTRMTGTTVIFDRPFQLAGMLQARPAERYRVEHFFLQTETRPQISFERTGSFIHLEASNGKGTVEQFAIEPDDLCAAPICSSTAISLRQRQP